MEIRHDGVWNDRSVVWCKTERKRELHVQISSLNLPYMTFRRSCFPSSFTSSVLSVERQCVMSRAVLSQCSNADFTSDSVSRVEGNQQSSAVEKSIGGRKAARLLWDNIYDAHVTRGKQYTGIRALVATEDDE